LNQKLKQLGIMEKLSTSVIKIQLRALNAAISQEKSRDEIQQAIELVFQAIDAFDIRQENIKQQSFALANSL